jgi:four helix bundle protein
MVKFRFEGLEIWQIAIEIADKLFDIADDLENKRLFRFADQLRGAGLSTPNNIAEGSGSDSKRDFANFLNMAKRSIFENANMIIMLRRRNLITPEIEKELLEELDKLSRKITSFKKSIK